MTPEIAVERVKLYLKRCCQLIDGLESGNAPVDRAVGWRRNGETWLPVPHPCNRSKALFNRSNLTVFLGLPMVPARIAPAGLVCGQYSLKPSPRTGRRQESGNRFQNALSLRIVIAANAGIWEISKVRLTALAGPEWASQRPSAPARLSPPAHGCNTGGAQATVTRNGASAGGYLQGSLKRPPRGMERGLGGGWKGPGGGRKAGILFKMGPQ